MSKESPLNATELAARQAAWVEQGHRGEETGTGNAPANGKEDSPFMALAREQHRRNYLLWHEEDQARVPDADDARIAGVKRRIDALNQERNDLIECLDDCLERMLAEAGVRPANDARWNTETPGSVVDRLSVLNLRLYHMREQAEREDASAAHRRACREKLALLERQKEALVRALQELWDDLFAGRKQLKLYRQCKMYNDPSLNPAVYKVRG